MDDLELAINENDLGILSFEVEDYADRISSIFEKYDSTISKLPSCYKGDAEIKIMSLYNQLKNNFSIIKDNIKSYSADYRDLISILNDADRKFAGIVDNLAEDKEKTAKSIYVDKKNNEIM